MKDWKERIAAILAAKEELKNSDEGDLWEYYSPEAAADMSEISEVQKKLSLSFTEDYIDFLLCANGWKCFYQTVNLFGTKDYETEMFVYAQKMLDIEVEYIDELREIRDHLLPIAITELDLDKFVMVLKEGEDYGAVIWLAGGEIERFDSFTEYFEAMIEYNMPDLYDDDETEDD